MPLSQRLKARDVTHFNIPRVYQIGIGTSDAPAGAVGRIALRNPLGSGILVRVLKISIEANKTGAGDGNFYSIFKPATVTGGTPVAQADIPKKDTAYDDARCQVLIGQLQGDSLAVEWRRIAGTYTTTANRGGPLERVPSWDAPDAMTLQEGQAVAIRPVLADADRVIYATFEWEEYWRV